MVQGNRKAELSKAQLRVLLAAAKGMEQKWHIKSDLENQFGQSSNSSSVPRRSHRVLGRGISLSLSRYSLDTLSRYSLSLSISFRLSQRVVNCHQQSTHLSQQR